MSRRGSRRLVRRLRSCSRRRSPEHGSHDGVEWTTPLPGSAHSRLVASTWWCWIQVVGETVFDVDAGDPVGVAADQFSRVDSSPAQLSGVRTETDHFRTEGVEQLNDLSLGLEDSANL